MYINVLYRKLGLIYYRSFSFLIKDNEIKTSNSL